MAYNRYSKLIRNGVVRKTPNIQLKQKSTDYYVTYKKGSTRLDNLSYDAYKDPNYDWLILMANQDIALMEFEIPDGATLRIPFPLTTTLEEYERRIDYYDGLYTID